LTGMFLGIAIGKQDDQLKVKRGSVNMFL